MTPEARIISAAVLRQAGLPEDTRLLVFGEGKNRHVAGNDWDTVEPTTLSLWRRLTWCNMFYVKTRLRLADRDEDATLPLCKGCLRTLEADVARFTGDVGDDDGR